MKILLLFFWGKKAISGWMFVNDEKFSSAPGTFLLFKIFLLLDWSSLTMWHGTFSFFHPTTSLYSLIIGSLKKSCTLADCCAIPERRKIFLFLFPPYFCWALSNQSWVQVLPEATSLFLHFRYFLARGQTGVSKPLLRRQRNTRKEHQNSEIQLAVRRQSSPNLETENE